MEKKAQETPAKKIALQVPFPLFTLDVPMF